MWEIAPVLLRCLALFRVHDDHPETLHALRLSDFGAASMVFVSMWYPACVPMRRERLH